MPIQKIRETLGPLAALRIADEARRQHADLGIVNSKTHVVVGDHTPEPRNPTWRGAPVNFYEGVIGRPGGRTRRDGGYGASFDD